VKAPLTWMREFAPLPDDAAAVASRLGACGFEVASVDGDVIDFEITANRPDCLSVYGLAREAATAFDVALTSGNASLPDPQGKALLPVSIGDAGCARYAMAVASVTIGPSPEWLAARLTAAGVRPINNIVDITNYVMLEVGHPMHAFDLAKLGGPEIRVRRARDKETLVTLDGVTRTLDDTMLVIADRERAVAVAGVMGGAGSEVSAATTKVAFESAWFLPASVRSASRRLGLKTEASARFERGADISAPARALRRALQLLTQTGAGEVTGGISDVYPRPAAARTVELSRARLARLLGDTVPDTHVERILAHLGFTVRGAADGWSVDVPTFRVDVAREADLIEEVGRHWGFDRIPATFPALSAVPRPMSPAIARDRKLRRILTGAGLQEACTFTFIEREAAEPFAADADTLVPIANPLSEKFAVLRPSLLPGLVDALVYSRRRETAEVRIFESGAVFSSAGETTSVGWLLTGARLSHWSGDASPADFFDARGIADLVSAAFGVRVSARAATRPWFVPGRTAEIALGDDVLGVVGEVVPALLAARGLPAGPPVVGGELALAPLVREDAGAPRRITPLPRFPSIVRDLSFFIGERLPAAEVRGTIRSNAPPTLVSVREFDRYQGKGVPDGMISLSVRLTFRDNDRTLTDVEVQRSVDAILAALAARHGAILRGKTE
jgi:phenylalanyl-tRNA synthetase beta chain